MNVKPASANTFLVILNPAAGGGRAGKRAPEVVDRLRGAGLEVEVRHTAAPGDGIELARQGFEEGYRNFIAGGGDGTAFEVLNGCLPPSLESEDPVRMGFLPLGTGNAYLQDFAKDLTAHTVGCLVDDRRRMTDVAVLRHRGGSHYFINLIGYGIPSEVTIKAAAAGLKRLGPIGYILAVFTTIAGLKHRDLPVHLDDGETFHGPTIQTTISNSRYTANGMLIAPDAKLDDGKVDLVTIAPMGRLSVAWAFPSIFSGKHVELDTIEARQSSVIHFDGDQEIDLMIDGEVRRVTPERVEVLQNILEVWA